jgi:hypothetical protein
MPNPKITQKAPAHPAFWCSCRARSPGRRPAARACPFLSECSQSSFFPSRQFCLRDLYIFLTPQTPQKKMVSVSVTCGSPGHKRIMMSVRRQLPAKPAPNPMAARTYNARIRLLTLPAPLSSRPFLLYRLRRSSLRASILRFLRHSFTRPVAESFAPTR